MNFEDLNRYLVFEELYCQLTLKTKHITNNDIRKLPLKKGEIGQVNP